MADLILNESLDHMLLGHGSILPLYAVQLLLSFLTSACSMQDLVLGFGFCVGHVFMFSLETISNSVS